MFVRTIYIAIVAISLIPIPAESLNILAIQTIDYKSNWKFMSALLRALTNNGHHVTVFTPFPDGERLYYKEIDISKDIALKLDIDSSYILNKYRKSSIMIPVVMNLTRYMCEVIYKHPKMKHLLNSDKSDYDLIITERTASECVTYVAGKLNLPIIFSAPSPLKTTIEYSVVGDVPNPATVSHVMAYHSVPRTFFQRFTNALFFMYSVYLNTHAESELKKTQPSHYDLTDPVKPSIVFLNTHYITESPRPFPPNVIQVGGIHLQPPKDIPKDILEYIENSPHGVIFFTFGSVIAFSTLPHHIQNTFQETLSQVPQRILWKYEGEMKNKPKNVMTRKWFSQREILLHPKVKLFISHGGISGVYEAIDGGVPVLGFPVFYDQPRNIEHLVDAGMAISLDLLTVDKDTLLNAVNDLVNNSKYQSNAKIASSVFKDRPMTPDESVVYWTEYVFRHKGATHLKSQAFNLTWYQYYLLDVISVVLAIISITIFVIYITLKSFLKYYFGQGRN